MTKRLLCETRTLEKIALLLLTLEKDNFCPEDTYDIFAHQAADLAYRVDRGLTDLTWRKIPGRPFFNEQMARVRAKYVKRLRKKK